MLAKYFQSVHNSHEIDKNKNIEDESIISEVENYIMQADITTEWDKYITSPKEILKEIKKLPSCKAPGIDNIQNIILKKLTRKAIVQITYIINATLKYSYFPQHWKTAKIIPILKPNKMKTDPSSYRPISLLNTIVNLQKKSYYSESISMKGKIK